MAIAVVQATTLNVVVFTYSPIKSRRFTSSKMKITTTGSQKPLPTCEKIRIFHSGAWGNSKKPAPTTIKTVNSQKKTGVSLNLGAMPASKPNPSQITCAVESGRIEEAPIFYWLYTILIVVGAGIV